MKDNTTHTNNSGNQLQRKINLPLLVLYGLGTILGAGIYVLIGAVAGAASYATPFAFLLAALVAGFSAMSYAALSSNYPKAGGESSWVLIVFHKRWAAQVVGVTVALAGIVSSATLANGFVGYLQVFTNWADSLVIWTVVVSMTAIAIWGVGKSAWAAALMTLIELLGLLAVLASGAAVINWEAISSISTSGAVPTASWFSPHAISLGAVIAFYAFIGFEDMVNVAEETHQAKRTMPIAIFITLITATVLYMAVSAVAVLAVEPHILAATDAPLVVVIERGGLFNPLIIAAISLVAVLNGILVQLIMASRIFYSLARQKSFPAIFGVANNATGTPILATLLSGVLILVFALYLPLLSLAKLTSALVLLIFIVVNITFIVFRSKADDRANGFVWGLPSWTPYLAIALNLMLIALMAFS